ncbi:MAG: 4Fe-4S binding protein [Selenomonadaceae bacterium]|nr:4Fe-4S binding protein [Selenomonadaceae bacterium]
MSIAIEKEKCVGCGRCAEVCPGNLLVLRDGKAGIREVKDCWGCTACVKECPRQAIFYYLAADLGGAGGRLYAQDSPDTLTWIMKWPQGTEDIITVNKNKSNEY